MSEPTRKDLRVWAPHNEYCYGDHGFECWANPIDEAEFDAIARKEGYVRLDVLLVAADADLVLNNARCDLVDPTIKRQWALARKRLRSVLAALDPEGDT